MRPEASRQKMILMNDFGSEPQELREAMLNSIRRVLESNWYILGSELKSFEQQWAAFCGLTYGVGVGNGMDAIEIALRTLKIGSGDEVITTPMTAFATVLAIIRSGAKPILADIDPDTALLSVESVQRCLSSRTKAIVLVHLYGQLRFMEFWKSFCDSQRLFLIEDCAQAHLAKWNGKMAGSFGAIGAYSFYPTKNLGALGDAGMLVTDDSLLAEQARKLRNYGQSERYHHPELGLNSRLDEIQAAVLSVRLSWLETFTERRRYIANLYTENIKNPCIQCLSIPEQKDSHVYHLYVVKCEQRDLLQEYLKSLQIQTLIHYPVPIHYQKSCRDIDCDPKGLHFSEAHAASCISLPCHPQMSDEDVRKIIDAINMFKFQ